MRIAVGQFGQETNTFNPVETDLHAFERFGLSIGSELVASAGNGGMSGFARVAQARGGVELVPLVRARCSAGGRVSRTAFDTIVGHLGDQLRAAGVVDAVYLELHGAMALSDHDDAEGIVLQLVRDMVGPDVRVVASLDHHAHVTQAMVDAADLLVAHRSQPHDPHHTGEQTAVALFRVVDEGFLPTTALRKAPMITHQEQFLTSKPPMKTWFALAREMEQQPGVLTVSTFPMQPWLDVEAGGWAALVVTDGDPQLAAELASELISTAWELRHDFMVRESVPVEEAVRRVKSAASGVVVLSDTGDSVLGGATGDSNIILAELFRQQVDGMVLVPLVDPPAAVRAAEAGEGAIVDFELGRALDPAWGDPLRVTAEVVKVTDGRIRGVGTDDVVDMGISALLRVGDVLVAVSQHRGLGGVHPEIWAHYGVDASLAKCVVVKTAGNFQWFASMASEVVRVDTPGHTQSQVAEFEWGRFPRPAFPLDAGAHLSG